MIAATRDSPDDDTLSLVGSSPIIIIEQNFKNPQPIFVNLPCERPKKMSKTYKIRINLGMCKKSIEYLASPVSAQNKNITALLLYVASFIGKNVTSM
jgi:hypothetical protein